MKKINLVALISMILIGCNAAKNDQILSGNTIEETNLHQHIARLHPMNSVAGHLEARVVRKQNNTW